MPSAGSRMWPAMRSNRLKINSKKSAMGIQTGAVISANVPVGREGRGGAAKHFEVLHSEAGRRESKHLTHQ